MADGGEDVLANFLAITNASEEQAIQCLDANNWSLDEAVQFFFGAFGDGAGAAGGGGRAGGGGPGRDDPPYIPPEEDEVRAPLPAKVDRLYGNHPMAMDPRMLMAQQAAQYGLNRPRREQPQVDVFRDFKAEGESSGSKPAGSGLSDLFKPPQDLLFTDGDLEAAKQMALKDGKWLLLNVQSANEFASHRLNRDTWSHNALKEVLQVSFLFYQQQDSTPEGQRLVSGYRLMGALPAVLVLDPCTGAKLYSRAGFVDPEKLMEDLLPFLDHGPLDPGAASIAQQMSMKRKVVTTAPPAAAAGGSGRAPMTEDEELAAAIAASLEGGAGPRSASGTPRGMATGTDTGAGSVDDMDADDDGIDEEAIMEQIRKQQEAEQAARDRKPPEQVQAEALSRLPAEPQDGLRVGFRMPDGSRLARRFAKEDTIASLHDYVVTQSLEAAGGRRFALAPMGPGAQALVNLTQPLQEANVAGALLVVKWEE